MARSQIFMVISIVVCVTNIVLEVYSELFLNFDVAVASIVLGSTCACLIISIIPILTWTWSQRPCGLKLTPWFTILGLILSLVQTVIVGIMAGGELYAQNSYYERPGIILCVLYFTSHLQVCLMTLASGTTFAKIGSKLYCLTTYQWRIAKVMAGLTLSMAICSIAMVICILGFIADYLTELENILTLLISNGFYFGFVGLTLLGLTISDSKESVWNVMVSGIMGTLFGLLQITFSILFFSFANYSGAVVSLMILSFSVVGTIGSAFTFVYFIRIMLQN